MAINSYFDTFFIVYSFAGWNWGRLVDFCMLSQGVQIYSSTDAGILNTMLFYFNTVRAFSALLGTYQMKLFPPLLHYPILY
jgi:uncharacterized membrane protein